LWAAQHYPEGQRTIAAKTARVVAEQQSVALKQVNPNTRFIQDLQMQDPLEGVELVMALEEEFDIKIPDDRSERIETLGDLITYLRKRIWKP
jgi:acyl carrier protein